MKKAQIWSLDVVISIFIFISALFLFYEFKSNVLDTQDKGIDNLIYEARFISENLMSPGYPLGWDTDDVKTIGLVDGMTKVNLTKVNRLTNLSYFDAKTKLKTDKNFYIIFIDENNDIINLSQTKEGYGKDGINTTNINSTSSFVNVERIVLFDEEIAKMRIYVW